GRRISESLTNVNSSLTNISATSIPWAEQGFAEKGVAAGGDRLGPAVVVDLRPVGRRAGVAVPADLLHRVVELHEVAVGVAGEGGIVDAGEQLRRQAADADAGVAEERQRGPKLVIAAELDAEGEQCRPR